MTEFGRPHLHLQRTGSTNQRARELAEAGAPGGTVVTAGAQSAGRGRAGRVWSAPAGAALLYSAVLAPVDLGHVLLPLAAPIAVCDAIESLAPVEAQIKWPNDVWLDEAKVAGVLIEARPPEWAVIGIGANVAIDEEEFDPGLRWPATSIGHGVTVAALRDAVSGALSDWVESSAEELLAAFRERDALAGREIGWEGTMAEPGRGVAAGVDERGNLLVDASSGERMVLGSGEVSLRLERG